MLPEHVKELTVVPSRVVDPPLCTIDPEEAKLVCVPIFVILFCVGVAMVPVNVAPEMSRPAVIPPVTARELPVKPPVPDLTSVPNTSAPLIRPVEPSSSARTEPLNTVSPTEVVPRLGNILETGSPLTVKFVQLTDVADTSTASMFLTTAFIVVGTYRGLCPHRLILLLVNITLFGR